ncbi:hypothetical protein IC582_015347 [Cucumis melo]
MCIDTNHPLSFYLLYQLIDWTYFFIVFFTSGSSVSIQPPGPFGPWTVNSPWSYPLQLCFFLPYLTLLLKT